MTLEISIQKTKQSGRRNSGLMSTKRSVKKIVSRIKPRYIDLNKVVTQRACMRALIRKHGYKRTKCILGFVKAYEDGTVIPNLHNATVALANHPGASAPGFFCACFSEHGRQTERTHASAGRMPVH